MPTGRWRPSPRETRDRSNIISEITEMIKTGKPVLKRSYRRAGSCYMGTPYRPGGGIRRPRRSEAIVAAGGLLFSRGAGRGAQLGRRSVASWRWPRSRPRHGGNSSRQFRRCLHGFCFRKRPSKVTGVRRGGVIRGSASTAIQTVFPFIQSMTKYCRENPLDSIPKARQRRSSSSCLLKGG